MASSAEYRAQLVILAGLSADNPNLSIADLEELASEDRQERAIRKALGTGGGTGGATGGGTGGKYSATYSATY
jgi:hypothetical protein